MRSPTPQECAEIAARHNAAVEREEIERAAVEQYRQKQDADGWDRLSVSERRAFLRVADAQGRGSAELDSAIRELSRLYGRLEA